MKISPSLGAARYYHKITNEKFMVSFVRLQLYLAELNIMRYKLWIGIGLDLDIEKLLYLVEHFNCLSVNKNLTENRSTTKAKHDISLGLQK